MSAVKIGWGKRQSGRLIHITEAQNGKKCNCLCPDCETPLVARQGEKTAWHFAHANPIECYGESVLHKVAKQIITEAAGTPNKFLTPPIEKEITSYDLAGKQCSTAWSFSEKTILIDDAREESRLDNGQIADVLITSSSFKSTVAIEIFVTHKKSDFDIDKFSEIQQDAIEVDLSNTDPLADRSTIEDQVLKKANRYWLFNQKSAEQQEIHNQKLDKINKEYFSEMVNIAMTAIKTGDLAILKFMWPQLTKQISEKGLYGETLFGEVTRTPKITKLNANNSYSLQKYGCLTNAIVENKTLVNVYFTLFDTNIPAVDASKPLLVFEYIPNEQEFLLTWFNIQKWEEKLIQLAQVDLILKQSIEQGKYQKQVAYAKNFVHKSDLERLQFLANELSLYAPKNTGQFLEHWNTTWHVWKTLVWKYKILRRQGDIIDVQHIANDNWFEQLLNWPQSEEAYEQRSKNIWFWFSRDLQQSGIVEHMGHMLFKVTSTLPDNFIPWAKK